MDAADNVARTTTVDCEWPEENSDSDFTPGSNLKSSEKEHTIVAPRSWEEGPFFLIRPKARSNSGEQSISLNEKTGKGHMAAMHTWYSDRLEERARELLARQNMLDKHERDIEFIEMERKLLKAHDKHPYAVLCAVLIWLVIAFATVVIVDPVNIDDPYAFGSSLLGIVICLNGGVRAAEMIIMRGLGSALCYLDSESWTFAIVAWLWNIVPAILPVVFIGLPWWFRAVHCALD